MQFMGLVGASYATSKDDRKSVTGGIFTVGGSITAWTSKTQQLTTLSSTEAEYVAIMTGAQELMFTRNLLRELKFEDKPGLLLCDNLGATQLVKNRQVSQQMQH